MPQQTDEEEQGSKGAPRYMTAYCSIMTLLLAFFIILQAFASVRQEGLFYAGRGSFVRALETFGLGGIWEGEGGPPVPGELQPRYRTPEGQDEPNDLRRIDAEREEAQRALNSLADQFDVMEPPDGEGWRVTLPTPFSYMAADEEFSERQREFCGQLARRLEPLVAARGFVIRIGAVLKGDGAMDAERARRALRAARRVQRRLVADMSAGSREAASRRLYSFCRPADERTGTAQPTTQLKVDIMLTKPYVRQVREEGVQKSETNETS
ncbi:MAG: flagellar motor protein MotB [Planctomycetota bacterium]